MTPYPLRRKTVEVTHGIIQKYYLWIKETYYTFSKKVFLSIRFPFWYSQLEPFQLNRFGLQTSLFQQASFNLPETVALELWVHTTGVASTPSFSPHRSCLVATDIEKRGKKKKPLSPLSGVGSQHAFTMLAARPRRWVMEGTSIKRDLPCLLAKCVRLVSWWGKRTEDWGGGICTSRRSSRAWQPWWSWLEMTYPLPASALPALPALPADMLVLLTPCCSASQGEAGAALIGRVPSSDSTCSTCRGVYFGMERSGG